MSPGRRCGIMSAKSIGTSKAGRTKGEGSDHPDHWSAGLRFSGKTLSTKSVARAATPADVLPVCLAHNLREDNGDHRHRHPIDPGRKHLNTILVGPTSPSVGAELVTNILDELAIQPARKDAIMGVELVIQAPDGADVPVFWSACLVWATRHYEHIVSAVVHRDQTRPHLHLLVLAVAGGRLAGNDLSSGPNRFALQRRRFLAHMRDTLRLRPDQPKKTLADLAVSPGKGAKTHAEAARRDAAFERVMGDNWKRPNVGMGVGWHGGSPSDRATPMPTTPLLRTASRLDSLSDKWASAFGNKRQATTSVAQCPKPAAAPTSELPSLTLAWNAGQAPAQLPHDSDQPVSLDMAAHQHPHLTTSTNPCAVDEPDLYCNPNWSAAEWMAHLGVFVRSAGTTGKPQHSTSGGRRNTVANKPTADTAERVTKKRIDKTPAKVAELANTTSARQVAGRFDTS